MSHFSFLINLKHCHMYFSLRSGCFLGFFLWKGGGRASRDGVLTCFPTKYGNVVLIL